MRKRSRLLLACSAFASAAVVRAFGGFADVISTAARTDDVQMFGWDGHDTFSARRSRDRVRAHHLKLRIRMVAMAQMVSLCEEGQRQ